MIEAPRDLEIEALRTFSAQLGQNRRRTQAAGGNTSLKRGDVMWIKASGCWLARAREQDIFVPVDLSALHAAFAADDRALESGESFVVQALNERGLRPSIETSVHAVLPYPVVAHIHCVETIALAVRRDRRTLLAERLRPLKDVAWIEIPYLRPGAPLAKAIAAALDPAVNVVILGNHGLVVAGGSVAEVKDRLERVCEALSATPRAAPPADLARLAKAAEGSHYRLPADAGAHAIALDPANLAHARGGSLYPDHVIFLGPGIVEARDVPSALATYAGDAKGAPPAMLAIPGLGVLLHRTTTAAADALALCLADVVARIPAGADIVRLTPAQEYELTNWEAEKYRQALDLEGRAP
jgi:rhamnose utilization protein RhaD (predicted bifunctional aldolase and dehydrogenase)